MQSSSGRKTPDSSESNFNDLPYTLPDDYPDEPGKIVMPRPRAPHPTINLSAATSIELRVFAAQQLTARRMNQPQRAPSPPVERSPTRHGIRAERQLSQADIALAQESKAGSISKPGTALGTTDSIAPPPTSTSFILGVLAAQNLFTLDSTPEATSHKLTAQPPLFTSSGSVARPTVMALPGVCDDDENQTPPLPATPRGAGPLFSPPSPSARFDLTQDKLPFPRRKSIASTIEVTLEESRAEAMPAPPSTPTQAEPAIATPTKEGEKVEGAGPKHEKIQPALPSSVSASPAPVITSPTRGGDEVAGAGLRQGSDLQLYNSLSHSSSREEEEYQSAHDENQKSKDPDPKKDKPEKPCFVC